MCRVCCGLSSVPHWRVSCRLALGVPAAWRRLRGSAVNFFSFFLAFNINIIFFFSDFEHSQKLRAEKGRRNRKSGWRLRPVGCLRGSALQAEEGFRRLLPKKRRKASEFCYVLFG
ncbi:hypothetical protein CSUI_010141 [Cystoisospora suis]|uniref:Transmembrane protein n=1 Tax=Cystoisospora suis TaxID=483139 RepID=A0A2C6KI77_9APIC|nr:hypothetical protein CSUI_010141 [Cystoisospora suis]